MRAIASQAQRPTRFWSQATSGGSFVEVALHDYAGTYVVQSHARVTILVRAEGGYLIMQVSGQPELALRLVSATKFAVAGTDDWVEFVGDENCIDGNRIRQLRLFQGGQLLIAQREDVPPQPDPAK